MSLKLAGFFGAYCEPQISIVRKSIFVSPFPPHLWWVWAFRMLQVQTPYAFVGYTMLTTYVCTLARINNTCDDQWQAGH